jgi:hypothetical protein
MARAAAQQENCCTCAGLVLEKERIAPGEGRRGIILVAMMRIENRAQRAKGRW